MASKVYKNEYGTLYAVVHKNGRPQLCCKAANADDWAVSGVLAACAWDGATTAEGLQAVLDRAAEVKGWAAVEEPAAQPQAPPADAPLAKTAPPEAAVFSYDGLDENTRQALRISEKMILEARQTFVVQVAEAVNIAHDALCSAVVANCDNGKFKSKGEDSFRSWCAYMGFSKDTAYRLLSVHKLLSGASAEEMAHLEAASPSLLYAAAKPSAPPELVQAVKDGDITTHKQYQEAMQRLRDMEAERNELEAQSKAEAESLHKQLDEARSAAESARMREEAAREAAHEYHTQLEQARAQNGTLLDQAADYIARIHEMETRPVEVAVQQPSDQDIEQWRQQGRDEVRRESEENINTMQRLVEKQGAQINRLQQQLKAAPTTPTADDCQRLMDTLADTLDGFHAMIRTTIAQAQLAPRQLEEITRRTRSALEGLLVYISRQCQTEGLYLAKDEMEVDPFAE